MPIKIRPIVAQKRQTNVMEIAIPAHIKIMARFLDRLGIPSEDCQSFTIGPKNLWLSNQAWKRSEDLEKHQAASNTKGVVGSRGKKIPIIPVSKESHPKIKYKTRFPVILLTHHLNEKTNLNYSKANARFSVSYFPAWKIDAISSSVSVAISGQPPSRFQRFTISQNNSAVFSVSYLAE